MTTTLESLQNFETEATTAYHALADRLASGEDADPKHARNILATAGKSVADLEAVVAHLRRVGELKTEIAALGDPHAELQKAQLARAEEIKRHAAERLELQERHASEHAKSMSEISRLEGLSGRKNVLLEELRNLESPPPPKVKPKVDPSNFCYAGAGYTGRKPAPEPIPDRLKTLAVCSEIPSTLY